MERLDDKITLQAPQPSVTGAYGHAWNVLKKSFLEIFLMVIILVIVDIPSFWLGEYPNLELDNIRNWQNIDYDIQGSIYSLLYWIFISTPVSYGVTLMFIKAVRGQRLDFKDILQSLNQFVDVILSNILYSVLVGIGIVLLIIPGIIVAIRLAFTPYLVMDKKMDAITAVKESWKLTGGYGWVIFAMAILAIPIFIGGLLLVGVGVILSTMWVSAAFASIYFAVDALASSGRD